jgi:hypothetical protein
MKQRAAHRGADGDVAAFAQSFLESRLAGFEKDMSICLTATPSRTRPGLTHAYFPALGASFGLIEYVSGLYRGNLKGIGWAQVADWAERYLPQPDYDRDAMKVFFDAFRHSVAHRGIASGIWVDRSRNIRRRVTWRVSADSRRPACKLIEEAGLLKNDPPWPTAYTHRMHIHLKALKTDLVRAVLEYAASVQNDRGLQANLKACMRQLYPL